MKLTVESSMMYRIKWAKMRIALRDKLEPGRRDEPTKN
jgi:hypothetical protein